MKEKPFFVSPAPFCTYVWARSALKYRAFGLILQSQDITVGVHRPLPKPLTAPLFRLTTVAVCMADSIHRDSKKCFVSSLQGSWKLCTDARQDFYPGTQSRVFLGLVELLEYQPVVIPDSERRSS